MTKERLKAYATLGGAFVLGAVSATAAAYAYTEQRYAELFSGDRDAFEARRVEVMSRELSLESEQQAGVREIFRKHAPERRRLMREATERCGAAMSAHRERIDSEIRALLTPEQRLRFAAMKQERERRMLGGAR